MKAGPIAALLIAAITYGATDARGNRVDAFGFGARAPAMGGAQTATGKDGAVNYYNPALLTTFEHIQLDIGYQTAVPKLDVNGLDLGVDSSRGFAVSLASPGKIGPVELAASGSLFLPDQHALRARALAAGTPRFAMYDNRPQRLFLAANLAFKLGSRLAIGGGVAYVARTEAAVALEGRLGFPDAEDSDLQLAIDAEVRSNKYPQAGLLFHATPWLDLGLSYRGSYELTLRNDVSIRGDVGAEGMPVVEDGYLAVTALARDLFQPHQVTAGLAAQLTPRVLVAFDASYHFWSRFENPATTIDIEIDAGMFNDLIEAIPDSATAPDPHYSDILIVHLGSEVLLARSNWRDIELRAGYIYEPSPAPEQVGKENFIDNDKHTASLGLGYVIHRPGAILYRPLRLSAYGAVTVLAPRSHQKVSPIDPVGDYRASGQIYQLGLSSTWSF